jgi:Flp pilus assembly protein TadG
MKSYLQKLVRLARDRDGSAMIELAIGSGLLVAAFTGTFQFGYTFFEYNNLENAVNRAAHYAALIPYDSPNSTPSTAFKTAVQNMVLYGQPTAGTSPVLPGLTTANVNFTVTFANNIPSKMTVSITGYSISSLFATTTLTNKPQVTFTYQGVWEPI